MNSSVVWPRPPSRASVSWYSSLTIVNKASNVARLSSFYHWHRPLFLRHCVASFLETKVVFSSILPFGAMRTPSSVTPKPLVRNKSSIRSLKLPSTEQKSHSSTKQPLYCTTTKKRPSSQHTHCHISSCNSYIFSSSSLCPSMPFPLNPESLSEPPLRPILLVW